MRVALMARARRAEESRGEQGRAEESRATHRKSDGQNPPEQCSETNGKNESGHVSMAARNVVPDARSCACTKHGVPAASAAPLHVDGSGTRMEYIGTKPKTSGTQS